MVQHVKCSHVGINATCLSNNRTANSAVQQAMDDGNFTGATTLWSATEFEAENLTDSVSFYNVLVHEPGTVPGNSAALQDWLATLDPHGELVVTMTFIRCSHLAAMVHESAEQPAKVHPLLGRLTYVQHSCGSVNQSRMQPREPAQ